MNMVRQLAIIATLYFAGEAAAIVFGLPIPGSVIGMVLMLAALLSGRLKAEQVEETSDLLLANFTFLFVPQVVGLMNAYHLLKDHALGILVVVFAGTLAVVVVTGLVVQRLIGRKQRR